MNIIVKINEMYRMIKLTIYSVSLLWTGTLFAQDLGLEEGASSVWNEIKGAAPYILAAVFLVSVVANSGKLTGDNRDYMAFFRGLLLWFGTIVVIGGIISYILSLKF